jgi:hypothetical protein
MLQLLCCYCPAVRSGCAASVVIGSVRTPKWFNVKTDLRGSNDRGPSKAQQTAVLSLSVSAYGVPVQEDRT